MSIKSIGYKIAILALIVSSISMIVAICNFLFTLWSYKNTEKIEISFQAETDPYSKVELHDNDFLVILKNNGVVSGGFKTFKEMVPYIKEGDLCFPEALTFYVECKITNLSKKPVTISNIHAQSRARTTRRTTSHLGPNGRGLMNYMKWIGASVVGLSMAFAANVGVGRDHRFLAGRRRRRLASGMVERTCKTKPRPKASISNTADAQGKEEE